MTFELLLQRAQLFIEQGGPVVWAVAATCLLLWTLIFERLWFIRVSYPGKRRQLIDAWTNRPDHATWRAQRIREAAISEADMSLHARISLIKTLIAICPLLGLLGTVTGMIAVFDVIAFEGTSDARAMARGVYRATIPTMAGLVVALSGLYFATRLQRLADREASILADRLMPTASLGERPGASREEYP